MAHLGTRAASLFLVFLMAVGNSGLFADPSGTDEVGTLTRQEPGLLEREPLPTPRESDMQEMRLGEDFVGALSGSDDAFGGVLAQFSSTAELVRFETLKPSDGVWRISHTRNPHGEFSLVRSSSEGADALFVSLGDGEAERLEPRQTLLVACGETQEIRVETDAGKVIYSGEVKCGDAVSLNMGVAQ